MIDHHEHEAMDRLQSWWARGATTHVRPDDVRTLIDTVWRLHDECSRAYSRIAQLRALVPVSVPPEVADAVKPGDPFEQFTLQFEASSATAIDTSKQ